MAAEPLGSIRVHFSPLVDPRIDRQKLHQLMDIIIIAICAVICGAETWVDIENFGKARIEWFRKFLELPNGIPSHDTFERVFGLLNAAAFEACFFEWVQAVNQVTQGQVDASLLARHRWEGIAPFLWKLFREKRHPSGQRLGQREPSDPGTA